jgi:hypothetical protein
MELATAFKGSKQRVNALLGAHAVMAAVTGSLAVLTPHLFEWFMVHHGEAFALRDNADASQKVTHLVTRLYGSLIVGQAVIVYSARQSSDAFMRRALVQAYWLVFTLTSLALLRFQTTPGLNQSAWNWANIALFVSLAVSYGWFALFERISVFESLGKAER